MAAVDLIRSLHEHRLWVRLRLLERASALEEEALHRTFPIGFGSVHATLVHLFAAEYAWMEALDGTAAPRFHAAGDFAGLAPLLREWTRLDERWGAFLDALDEAGLARPVTRTTRAGVTFTTPAADVLLHVCTHAMYHAAQLVNMLRHLGATELPETNYITFARER